MKLKQKARVLRKKALSSLTNATTAVNSPVEDGWVTQVLLSLQHSFEMLIKAALAQGGVAVHRYRDRPATERSGPDLGLISLSRWLAL